jgi:Protein of unknown function (DUF2946)
MDDIVLQAMQKWPNVPDCYGWLGLSARGDWYMRDMQTQEKGVFTQSKGSRLEHEGLIAFLGRNYASDELGQWYFQNGPQRVFVELENTPWVWRIEPDGQVFSHIGAHVQVNTAWLDENGQLYFETTLGLGLVHTQDMQRALQWFEPMLVSAPMLSYENLAVHFGFVRSPQMLQVNKKPT